MHTYNKRTYSASELFIAVAVRYRNVIIQLPVGSLSGPIGGGGGSGGGGGEICMYVCMYVVVQGPEAEL
jgi:hypothetical protein